MYGHHDCMDYKRNHPSSQNTQPHSYADNLASFNVHTVQLMQTMFLHRVPRLVNIARTFE